MTRTKFWNRRMSEETKTRARGEGFERQDLSAQGVFTRS